MSQQIHMANPDGWFLRNLRWVVKKKLLGNDRQQGELLVMITVISFGHVLYRKRAG
jgi:hypothetical protein